MKKNTIAPGDKDPVDHAGMPSIGRRKRSGTVVKVLVLATLAGIGVAWAALDTGGKHGPAKAKPGTDEVANHLAPLAAPDRPPPPVAAPLGFAAVDAPPPPATGEKPGQPAPHVPTWEERKLGFEDGEAAGQHGGTTAAPSTGDAGISGGPAGPAPAAGTPAAPAGSLAARLEAPAIDTVRASFLPDRNYLLAAGTLLDCILDTRIDSTLPGRVKCHLNRDVYSDNRQVLLLERGTEMLGEQGGGILQGQARQFVLFLRAKTPNGVVVNLNSPATDALGASGIEGWVDTQFRKRFGAALAIALLQDLTAVAVANQSSGNGQNTFVLGNTAQAGSALAEKALESSLNIPPILHVNQGAHIQVMLARDLDFRDVYELRRTTP